MPSACEVRVKAGDEVPLLFTIFSNTILVKEGDTE